MFSETVDNVLTRVQRLELFTKSNAISYVNFTLKELSSKRLFYRDRIENSIDISGNSTNAFIWARPKNFRQFETVKFIPSLVFPRLIPPGPQQDKEDHYYYGGSTYFVFNGVQGEQNINLSYFVFPPTFKYYEPNTRPAKFDRETETWLYLNEFSTYVPTLQTEGMNETAEERVFHWLLLSWSELIEEGAMAKALKSIDDPRARSTFAVFRDMFNTFTSSEPFEGKEIKLIGENE